MKSENVNKDKILFKNWLEKLQQESWHLELIISGFAIFAIHSLKPFLQELEFFRYEFLTDSSTVFIFVFFNLILNVGWKLFFINLIIHVIFRGLWIGAIGLRSVSGDIDYNSLKFSQRFHDYLLKKMGSFDDYIERLERFCSTVFSFTFLLFLIFVSVLLFMGFGLLIVSLTDAYQAGYQSQTGESINTSSGLQPLLALILMVYLILGVIVFLDLIFNGAFKKINDNIFSKVYFYIYKFYSTITLSFLYRPLLYNFLDNKYTRKFFYFSIPYLFILIIYDNAFVNRTNPFMPNSTVLMESGHMIDDYYYDDLRSILLSNTAVKPQNNKKEFLPWVSLSQYKVNGNFIEIFFKQTRSTIKNLEKSKNLKPIHKKGIQIFENEDEYFVAPDIKKQVEDWEVQLKAINEEKRIKRRLSRKDSNPEYQVQIDSLEASASEISLLIKSQLKRSREEYMIQLKKEMISNMTIKINEEIYPLDNCFFYKHPHFGEQGVKCILPIDSLDKSVHYIKILRNYWTKNNEIETDSLILPFINN